MLCHVARFVVIVVGFSAVNGFSSYLNSAA